MLRRFVLAASFLIFCTPSLVSACSCVVGGGKCDQSWNRGNVIFTGTVTRELTSTKRFERIFELSVSESFRGPAVAGRDITIYTGTGGGDCGYRFKVGTSYLVYAHLDGNRLETSICSHTNPTAETAHMIQQLRALHKGERVAALFGMIRKYPIYFADPPPEVKPLGGSRVRVIGSNNFEQSTTTDQEGVFSFSTLPADTYRIEVEPPPGMSNWHLNRGYPFKAEIGATEAPGCLATLAFGAVGRIKGKVVNEYGSALAGSVTLEPADPRAAEEARRSGGLISATTETGDFELLLAGPGRYRLSYRPKAGGGPPVMSEVITVNLGGRVDDFRFKVPATRR